MINETVKRALALASVAGLLVGLAGMAGGTPPAPQLYRLDVSTIVGQGEVEVDPQGTPGAPGVYWYWSQSKSVMLEAIPDDPEWAFKEWRIGQTGEAPEVRTENPTVVNLVPDADDWTAVAVFENGVDTHTIVASAGDGGTIQPSGNVEVEEGQDQEFLIKPDEGYFIAGVWVNGADVYGDLDFLNGDASYTFIDVTEAGEIHAEFAPVAASKRLEQGWHLISVPTIPDEPDPENVFRSVIASGQELSVYEWAPGTSYREPESIDPGHGYWLYLWDELKLVVQGTLPTDEYEVELAHKGWHLISTPRWPVAWENVQFDDGDETKSLTEAISGDWIEPYAFLYSAAQGDYVAIELPTTGAGVDPWRGYWVKTRVPDLTMILPLGEPWIPDPPFDYLTMAQVPARLRPPEPPASFEAVPDSLTAVGYPSPVTGDRATFRVSGLPVDGLRVTVFDVSGRVIWQAEGAGSQLSWNLTDEQGVPVANGVYLYKVEARSAGQWLTAGYDTLLISR